jgi:hypothetical protein
MKGQKKSSSGRAEADEQLAMAEPSGTAQTVERVVSQVLEGHIGQIRQDLVRRVLEELPASAPSSAVVSQDDTAANLLAAISAIHAGTSQKEILRALLDNTVRYSGRAALFVIKAGAATGWQGRGLSQTGEHDELKDFSLDVSAGLVARAMQSRMVVNGAAREMDPQFILRFQAPLDDSAMLLPLLLKEKIAALVYADAGLEAGGKIDAAALELLVMATSAWLEVTSLRKQAHKEGGLEAGGVEKTTAASASPVQTVSSFSDPFAAHAPKHQVETAPAPVAMHEPATVVEAEPVAVAAAAAASPATDASAQLPPEEADIHRKAQRFARLLVDEIKLYNQAKVAEGRKHKDLYDRLKEDIEKSRGTYRKRYGNTAAADTDYFSQELVRSLAEDDSSIMGANFRR